MRATENNPVYIDHKMSAGPCTLTLKTHENEVPVRISFLAADRLLPPPPLSSMPDFPLNS